jgi:hypothetical protein
MLLNVAVEERQPRLIGSEIDNCAAKIWNYNCILQNARRLLSVDLGQLP